MTTVILLTYLCTVHFLIMPLADSGSTLVYNIGYARNWAVRWLKFDWIFYVVFQFAIALAVYRIDIHSWSLESR